MANTRSILQQVRVAASAVERERRLGAAMRPLAEFVALNFDTVCELHTRFQGDWSSIAQTLRKAFPTLATRSGRPVDEAVDSLKKAFHKEKAERSRRASKHRTALRMGAREPAYRPAQQLARSERGRPTPATVPGWGLEADDLVVPELAALKSSLVAKR